MKFSRLLLKSNLTFYLSIVVAGMTALSGVLLAQVSVSAEESTIVGNLNYQEVSQETAIANAINVSVNPGRIAVIDFSATDQAISYIGLGDASRVVYNTDLPLQSGSAQTIFLLPIEELDFPGATTTRITNLVTKTVDASGVSRVYNFQINHSNNLANLGIKITPQTRNSLADIERHTIKVSYGRTANLDDVARGLTLALERGLTTADDPVVSRVRRFIALARNSELTVVESAQSADIDLAVISSLAEMALEQFSFELPDENSVTDRETETEVQDSDELSSRLETIERSTLDDREDDLSGYLTKPTPQRSSAKEISFDERVDYVLQAHNLHFGWQRVVQQGILEIDRQTQAQVNRAISSVRNGISLEAALAENDISEQIGSLLLAISRGDTDAISSPSMNVPRSVE